MKIAFVIQRYGIEINGGAELHCRYVAEHLAKHLDVEVLTTCAKDYITWKNEYSDGQDTINGVPILRFRVEKERNPATFGRLQEQVFRYSHSQADEMRWIDEQGPCSPELIRYIIKNQDLYDFFIFFSYRYFHSYYGIRSVPQKSVLVPTAEPDPTIHLSLFKELFNLPRAFVYNSVEEKRMINTLSANYQIPGGIVGVGSEIPSESNPDIFRKKFNIDYPFLLYIGRIDENKGCAQLFDFFLRFRSESDARLKLVLIGAPVMKIPTDQGIVHLGAVNDPEKYGALAACELLVMPSFFESLSMVLLEAWGMGRPTLANSNCRVLMGQSIRSNAGLFYTDYQEFKRCLLFLRDRPHLRHILGRNGKRFYEENYRWEIIEQKYLNLINAIKN